MTRHSEETNKVEPLVFEKNIYVMIVGIKAKHTLRNNKRHWMRVFLDAQKCAFGLILLLLPVSSLPQSQDIHGTLIVGAINTEWVFLGADSRASTWNGEIISNTQMKICSLGIRTLAGTSSIYTIDPHYNTDTIAKVAYDMAGGNFAGTVFAFEQLIKQRWTEKLNIMKLQRDSAYFSEHISNKHFMGTIFAGFDWGPRLAQRSFTARLNESDSIEVVLTDSRDQPPPKNVASRFPYFIDGETDTIKALISDKKTLEFFWSNRDSTFLINGIKEFIRIAGIAKPINVGGETVIYGINRSGVVRIKPTN